MGDALQELIALSVFEGKLPGDGERAAHPAVRPRVRARRPPGALGRAPRLPERRVSPGPVVTAVLFDFGGVVLTSPLEAFDAYEREQGLPTGIIRRIGKWVRYTVANTDSRRRRFRA